RFQPLLHKVECGDAVLLGVTLSTQAAVGEQFRRPFVNRRRRTALSRFFAQQLEDRQLRRLGQQARMETPRPQRRIQALQILRAAENSEETNHPWNIASVGLLRSS